MNHPTSRLLTALWGLWALCMLSACPKRNIRTMGAVQKFDSCEKLLAAMAESRPARLAVTGMVEYRNGSQRIKVRISYVARKPATLRFETESFFEQPLSILVTDGMSFSSWDMKNGRFITGRATMANISKVIPVPMDGADMARMLLGQVPIIAYARDELTWKNGQYILTLSNARQTETIVVAASDLTPKSVKLSVAGHTSYTLELSGWLKAKERFLVPGKIRFEMPSKDIKVRIKLFEASVPREPNDKIFELSPPNGAEIENWN